MTSVKKVCKHFFCLLLCGAMLLSMTACGKNEVDGLFKNAWVAAGEPYGVERVYHYAFQGTEALNTQAGGDYTLADGFALKTEPENGHLFILQMGGNSVYVLENENGNVLGVEDYAALKLKSDRHSNNLKTRVKTANEQYEDGLISDAEMNRIRVEIQSDLDTGMAYAEQMVCLSSYGVCAAMCPVSEKAEPNSWHQLTDEQLEKVWED